MKKSSYKKIFGPIIFIAFFAAFTAVAMLLWNALLPEIFGIKAINFWQTAGLLILIRLFFGGIGHHSHKFRKFKNRKHYLNRYKEGEEFREKLKSMTKEERREYIKERMRAQYGCWDDPFDNPANISESAR